MRWRALSGKNTRVTCARRIIERGRQPRGTIALTHTPNGGSILVDFAAYQHHSLSDFRATQQNLRTSSDSQGRLSIAQELLKGPLIFGAQHKRLRLPTAHRSAPGRGYA